MTITIFDTPWNMGPKAGAMHAAGLRTAIRYINHQNSVRLPEKRIAAAERAAIKAAGLTLALVFQQRQDRKVDFTAEAGKRAATRAFTYARDVLGRPSGRPIYFSVDADLFKVSELAAVDAFFQAVNATLADLSIHDHVTTPVGVYGSGTVCGHLRAKGLATFFWVAQSPGWNDAPAFLASGAWHLHQGATTTFQGVAGDPNEVNPQHPDFGAFTPTL